MCLVVSRHGVTKGELFGVEGLCAYGGQVCLTTALLLVEAAPVTAMSYLTVVWGLILGFFVFREVC